VRPSSRKSRASRSRYARSSFPVSNTEPPIETTTAGDFDGVREGIEGPERPHDLWVSGTGSAGLNSRRRSVPVVPDDQSRAKVAAARRGVEQVRPGMCLALGTGSTAGEAVRALAARFPGETFDCVASSRATEELAGSLGIPVRPLRADDRFDLMLDGADEVTPSLDLTKGGGGALLREKLLARLSKEVVILVDPTKLVAHLGERAPIPVEVVPFARAVLARRFAHDGFRVHHRQGADGRAYLTDNGNELLDLTPLHPIGDPGATAAMLAAATGVVETGIFVGLASRVLIGHPDGRVEERTKGPSPAP
jgi:ribose 5-phosphate isomerase A